MGSNDLVWKREWVEENGKDWGSKSEVSKDVRESDDAHKCAKHSSQIVRVSAANVDQTRRHQAYESTGGEAESKCEDDQSGKRVPCVNWQPDDENGDGSHI